MTETRREHALFEASDAAQRYVLRQMPPAQRARFEEHFLECPACLERLELERGLREGLAAQGDAEHAAGLEQGPAPHVNVAEAAAAPTLPVPRGPTRAVVGVSSSRTPWLRPALAAALALIVGALLLRELVRARRELAAWRRHAGLASPDNLEAERARWRALLEHERQQAARTRAQLETALAQAHEPAARTLVLNLEAERSAVGAARDAPHLSLPAQPALVMLVLSSAATGGPVEVALHAGTRPVWQGRVHSDVDGSVWIALPSAWLSEGPHALKLTHVTGGRTHVERYAFRVSMPAR